MLDDFDFCLQSNVNLSSINFNIVGESDIDFMDDGFEVEVKFECSLFNFIGNVDFNIFNKYIKTLFNLVSVIFILPKTFFNIVVKGRSNNLMKASASCRRPRALI